MIKIYYQLAKPGIIYGNILTLAAGFFLAEKGRFNLILFLSALVGLSLVIASACVFNNLSDREIDRKMERTKDRAMVRGVVSKQSAIIYGSLLGICGFGLLFFGTNFLACLVALLGWIVYVLIYTPYKPLTTFSTLIGSVAGATPPVVGYIAVTNKLDSGAIILFLILVFWQMPHFYAIAIYRLKDYTSANIPVLPVKSGIKATKIQMMLYILAFVIAAIMLKVIGLTGYTYLIAVIIFGIFWLKLSIEGFSALNNALWAKKMFRYSLIILTLLCVIISVNRLLP